MTTQAHTGETAQQSLVYEALHVIVFSNQGVVLDKSIDLAQAAHYRLGSSPECELHIPNVDIGPVHCVLHVQEGRCVVESVDQTTGVYYNGQLQKICTITDGDLLGLKGVCTNGISAVLSFNNPDIQWVSYDISRLSRITIGRDAAMDITLAHDSVGAHAADFARDTEGRWFISPVDERTGIFINTLRLSEPTLLSPSMHILVGHASFLFFEDKLFLMSTRLGIDVEADNLVRYRGRWPKKKITNDHISLHIRRGEFVAIVGGSGSGKSTLLNELNGSEPADEGRVYIDGIDFYSNYDVLRSAVGYVPQKDIVHDNLSIQQTLQKAAQLRMPPDTTKEEQAKRVDEVITLLQLDEFRFIKVANLSGGQRKRVSIAVALLCDPRLLYLDEPTSGLDPSLDRDLMMNLADMAHSGRTIILVTHTTANLHMCDRVVILGRGGKLCYFGPPAAAPAFFEEKHITDIYEKIDKEPEAWAHRFAEYSSRLAPEPVSAHIASVNVQSTKAPFFKQLGVLSSRYLQLIINDRSRLGLLLLQAPILAALIAWVTGDGAFELFENTRSSLFALSCAAFWVGILNSIQEICKETEIFKREYEGGVRIETYVSSKVLILSALSIFQSLLITFVYCQMVPMARADGLTLPFQMFVSISLITLSAMALGLLVSSLFTNSDRAIAMAPMLIMPQILFSGIVVELKGAIDVISKFIFCRWGMQALGTSADLNAMDLALYGTKINILGKEFIIDAEMGLPRSEIDIVMFAPSVFNLFTSWAVLALLTFICIGGTMLSLRWRVKRA